MERIHATAVVHPSARIGQDATVGPFCILEENVTVGDGTEVCGHVVLKAGTQLGCGNRISEGAVLGARPQHMQAGDELGTLIVGDRNNIRENATIHCALTPGHSTVVGDENLVMVNAHIAHDCQVGNRTIMANNVMLAGHVEVGDGAYLAGAAGFHQFCRIGCYAIVGGQAHIKADVPPYVMVDGKSSSIVGLNRVGLQRNGFSTEEMAELKQAYRLIYRSGLDFAEIQQQLAEQFPAGPAAAYHEFFSGGSRGFVPERKAQRRAGLAIVRPDEPQRETRKAG